MWRAGARPCARLFVEYFEDLVVCRQQLVELTFGISVPYFSDLLMTRIALKYQSGRQQGAAHQESAGLLARNLRANL